MTNEEILKEFKKEIGHLIIRDNLCGDMELLELSQWNQIESFLLSHLQQKDKEKRAAREEGAHAMNAKIVKEDMKAAKELFELEQQLDIPMKDRFHKTHSLIKGMNSLCANCGHEKYEHEYRGATPHSPVCVGGRPQKICPCQYFSPQNSKELPGGSGPDKSFNPKVHYEPSSDLVSLKEVLKEIDQWNEKSGDGHEQHIHQECCFDYFGVDELKQALSHLAARGEKDIPRCFICHKPIDPGSTAADVHSGCLAICPHNPCENCIKEIKGSFPSSQLEIEKVIEAIKQLECWVMGLDSVPWEDDVVQRFAAIKSLIHGS